MGLRSIAEQDLRSILADSSAGFSWDLIVTSPSESSETLPGFSNDISEAIDPDTGQIVSGRSASVAISMRLLLDAFGELPVGIEDDQSKPWLVQFEDIVGVSHLFKVQKSNPDRAIGLVTCLLESYV